MKWARVAEAAKTWAGGVNPKTIYKAIRAGDLKAARIGAGRNMLVCEEWVNEWLQRSVLTPDAITGQIVARRERRRYRVATTPALAVHDTMTDDKRSARELRTRERS